MRSLSCALYPVQLSTLQQRRICQGRTQGTRLDRKLELLALENLGVVDVEEVAVEDGLNQAGNDGNPVDLVLGLAEVTPQPVGQIQATVDTEREEVVRCNRLGFASALEHEKLRENGDGFEPDGEGPKDLGQRVLVREQDGENGSTGEQKLDFEGVDVGIVGWLVGVRHEVDDVSLRTDEHDLENQVIQAVCREKI